MPKTPKPLKADRPDYDSLPVFEAVFTFRAGVMAGSLEEAKDTLRDMTLEDLDMLTDTGPMLGSGLKRISLTEVDPVNLVEFQEAMGNDGSFFPPGNVPQQHPDPVGQLFRLQVERGWAATTLGFIQQRFIEENGLQSAMLGYAEAWAQREIEASDDYRVEDGDDEPEDEGDEPEDGALQP